MLLGVPTSCLPTKMWEWIYSSRCFHWYFCYRFTVGPKPNCVLISKKINEQETIKAAPFPSHSVNLHFPRQVAGWGLFQRFAEIGCGVICTEAR